MPNRNPGGADAFLTWFLSKKWPFLADYAAAVLLAKVSPAATIALTMFA
jgi:hypothetical protein